MLFLLLFGSTFFTYNTGYKKVENYPWSHCHNSSFSITDNSKKYDVNYLYCSHQQAISREFIDETIRKASSLSFEYMKSLNLTRIECQNLNTIEVYEVEMSFLNDQGIFNEWKSTAPDAQKIWALYDPRNKESGVASIILTDHGDWNPEVFAHEIGHYWYDRFCLGTQYNYQVEPFALAFEEYYKQNK
jgi:hypothetical protein